jgi:hypothetical protein
VIGRGNLIMTIASEDGYEQIDNPYVWYLYNSWKLYWFYWDTDFCMKNINHIVHLHKSLSFDNPFLFESRLLFAGFFDMLFKQSKGVLLSFFLNL